MKKSIQFIISVIIAFNTLQAQAINAKLGGATSNETFDVTDSGDNLLFRIQGDGKVGIGTSNPGVELDIISSQTDWASRLRLGNSDKTHTLFLNGGHSGQMPYISFRENDALLFSMYDGTNNELMRIESNGNVGIGTTNPISKLSVGGDGYGTASLFGETDTGMGVYGVARNNTGYTNFGGYFIAQGTTGQGVSGKASNTGVYKNYGGKFSAGGRYGQGVYGEASNNGQGTNYGGFFVANGTTGRGVYGVSNNEDDNTLNYGGYFTASGTLGTGVYGNASNSSTDFNYGGYFVANGTEGRGVYGVASTNTANTNYGGYFEAWSLFGNGVYGKATGSSGIGVNGYASNPGTSTNWGGYFKAAGTTGRGVYGEAESTSGTNYGVYGKTNSSEGFAGYFVNKTYISQLGIGTENPARKLDVQDESSSTVIARFTNTSGSASARGMEIKVGRTTNPEAGNDFIVFRKGDNSAIGAIYGNGSGGVTYGGTSDARLKTNISDLTNGLDIVESIKARRYEMITAPGIERIGFIAQELKQVYPQAVSGDPDGDVNEEPMMVDYSSLTPILVQAVKELKQLVIDQQKRIELLESM